MGMKLPPETFWITNISKKAISLYDLNMTIHPFRSINLLDQKHYSYTKSQLMKSAENGSLFKKRNYVVIRRVPPYERDPIFIPIQPNATMPVRYKSGIDTVITNHEELNIADEEFAEENSEMAETDHLGKWVNRK
jgi:hypothetical protein